MIRGGRTLGRPLTPPRARRYRRSTLTRGSIASRVSSLTPPSVLPSPQVAAIIMSVMATPSAASVRGIPAPATRRVGARRPAPVVCRAAAPRDAAKLSAGILAVAAANAARAEDVEAPADAVVDAPADAAAQAAAQAADAAADAAAQAADAAAKAAAQASDALNGALGGLSGGLDGLTSQAGGALEGLKGGLGGITSQAGGAIGGLGSQAGGAIGSAAKGVGSIAGPALSGAAKVAGEGAGVVGQGLGQATKAVGGATSAVSGAVGGATSAVNSTLTSTVQSLESALPPEFQDVVARAQTDSDTAVALIGLTAAVPIGLVVLGAATRGYAGDKNPFVVEEQLKKDRRAFLIDTRSEDARRNDGVPDLRGKARGKGAAVEVATLPADERRVLSNPRLVELELAATKVKALTKGGARVYVLGPDAKDLAKAITRLGGRRAFVVSGGFDAWRSSGLKVGVKYAKSALEGLGEDTSEAASSFTQKVAGSVKTSITTKKPTDAIVPLLGLVAAAAAAYNYKTALEYAGVIGIELTILAKLLSYESPWAFFEDVKETAAGVVGAVGSFEPPSVPEVSVPKVKVPSVAEMAPPPRPAPAPAKEEAKVEEVVEEEEVAEPEPEAAAPAPVKEEAAAPAPVEEEAAAPAPAAEKKAGRVYDETYAESKSEMAKAAEEAARRADKKPEQRDM